MLFELLRRAADEEPDQAAVVTTAGSTSYAELLERSGRFASGLSERSIDRFACLVDDVTELVALLCASSLTGAEACVYPDRLDAAEAAEFAERFGHATVV